MKTTQIGANIPQVRAAASQSIEAVMPAWQREDDGHAEESFEATILRLDSVAAERLFRHAGE